MTISMCSVPVVDDEHALQFYTNMLGFVKKTDFPAGEYRWLTVVSPEEADATQLLLEPNAHAATQARKLSDYRNWVSVLRRHRPMWALR